jgi:hypothetical protein
VSDKPASATRLSSHLAVCGGASVFLYTYPDRSPILTVGTGEVSLTIAMSRTDLDATAMRFVREFADAVARFAENCEHFAESSPGPASSSTEPPASSPDVPPERPARRNGSAPRASARSKAWRAA